MFQVTCEELTVWEHMSGYPKYLLDQIPFRLCTPFKDFSLPKDSIEFDSTSKLHFP